MRRVLGGISMHSLAGLLLLAAVMAGNALADDNSVKRAFEARFSGLRVVSVTKTPFNGLYELVIGDEIVYTDERATFVINGNVIDARTKRNITEERLQKIGTIKFDALPFELAIKTVRGNGKRVVAIFADPYCPYCKVLDKALRQVDNVTLYTFLYPILREVESPKMARQIWCAPDRSKAYFDFMLNNKPPAGAANCDAPIEQWKALGQKLGVRATPTSFVPSGQRILGARVEELQKAMN